jgi:cell wall-active antibiotic response 4TMS protein YvqF/B-box zinc finger protein
MRCAVHPEVEASGYCRNCGKALCAACVRPVRDVLYCEDCLANITGLGPAATTGPSPSGTATPGPAEPMATPPPASTAGNPGIAFLLGLVPGLGAIYNGEYNKALIHIVVFAAIIVGLSSDIGSGATTALAFVLVGFIFYMAIDAMRTVKARNAGQVTPDPLESWSKSRPVGPIILIAVGGLFLLNNFGFFDYFRVRQLFWPLVLIGVGVLMLRNRVGGQSGQS